jgi:microsomal dipeptidase-like Zn-dependent dipeptidase
MGIRPIIPPFWALTLLPVFVSAIHAQTAWGYADLHTHPASHLGFGADTSGNNGIIWGKPGNDYESAVNNVGTDLPPCLNTHVVLFPNPGLALFSILSVVPSTPIPVSSFHGSPNDYIQLETQRLALSMLDQEGPPDKQHHEHGAPGFQDWPSASIVEHQQMHITAIKRAYLGGLRLMFAAAVNTQILYDFWTKTGFNVFSQVPDPEQGFDYRSAVTQLQFIQNEAAANSTWMQVVKTPAEARQAIAANKLAVVLSLEMDSLTPNEVQSLIAVYNVRHVTPIHLANSPFGGSAVYNDNWNTNNWFLNNHQFVQVDFDTNITFNLGKPQSLMSAMGALIPTPISDDDYNKLGYQGQAGGHKNHIGLTDTDGFQGLMEAGVMIDLAHMSEKSVGMALSQAEIYGFPLMDSHTGIRNPLKPASLNERSLLNSQATRIGNLGGVLGLGVAWDKDSTDPIGDFSAAYQNALLLLGGRGVALGTDANGLQTLIDFTRDPLTDYVHNIAARFSPPAGVQTPDLNHYTIGSSRPFDIHTDGLANYGMLPDFLEAVWEYSDEYTGRLHVRDP